MKVDWRCPGPKPVGLLLPLLALLLSAGAAEPGRALVCCLLGEVFVAATCLKVLMASVTDRSLHIHSHGK
jgi:hypothetical protein